MSTSPPTSSPTSASTLNDTTPTTYVTSPHTNITHLTSPVTATPGGGSDSGTVVAIIGTVVLLGALVGVAWWYFRKNGHLLRGFTRVRSRARSNTTDSQRGLHGLDEAGPAEVEDRRRSIGEEVADDAFTIEEMDDADDAPGHDEEYYYDEVFGQSPFRDTRTNSSVRELQYAAPTDQEEEVLDYDFETLGINIDDYKINTNTKNRDV